MDEGIFVIATVTTHGATAWDGQLTSQPGQTVGSICNNNIQISRAATTNAAASAEWRRASDPVVRRSNELQVLLHPGQLECKPQPRGLVGGLRDEDSVERTASREKK